MRRRLGEKRKREIELIDFAASVVVVVGASLPSIMMREIA